MRITPALAEHLTRRVGLGARPEEVASLVGLPWEATVQRLLREGLRPAPVTRLPGWSDDVGEEDREERRAQGQELKAWWVRELLATPAPLTERLTLMWHGHFTSSLRKVKLPALLLRQNLTLRREGTRSFAALLEAMSRDAAMLLYLDNARSHRDHPNENFAREVMELFVLGEGAYGEEDVREVARAFTGWRLNRATGSFRFGEGAHDDGEKVILGQRGRWRGEDALRILLEQPAASRHVARRLWREFAAMEPDPAGVEAVAATLRRRAWSVPAALETLLTHPAFWDPQAQGAMIKSPVELVIGAVRSGELEAAPPKRIARLLRRLGQDLFDPPNVRGWPGGLAWITTQTLLVRYAALERAAEPRLMDPSYQLK